MYIYILYIYMYIITVLFQTKAPAKGVGRLCRAVTAEVLQAGGTLTNSATIEAARMSERNSERDAHRLFNRYGLAEQIPISWYRSKQDPNLLVPNLRVDDIIKMLYKRSPRLLFGGRPLPAHLFLENFWANYKKANPDHDIYTSHPPHMYGKIIPVLSHGDGGRGFKKTPVNVYSIQTAYGYKSLRVRLS
jgi:hypothetical protein